MPAFQKAEFCKESTEAFKKQRESCLKAGVRIRPVQRQGLEDSNRVDSGKIGIALQNTPGTNMLGTSFKIVGPAKGQGSFGAVYVVEHVHSRRRYAAKVEPVLASLDREIQILKGISHEAILPVLCSHVEDGGLSWYIMPLLPTNLFAYLRSENQFAHGSQDALFNQLMDGLGFLHDRGVVHADIKPGNIVYNPGTEHFYIIDFGIAVVLPTPRGQTTESVYTLAFRPPELIETWCWSSCHCDSVLLLLCLWFAESTLTLATTPWTGSIFTCVESMVWCFDFILFCILDTFALAQVEHLVHQRCCATRFPFSQCSGHWWWKSKTDYFIGFSVDITFFICGLGLFMYKYIFLSSKHSYHIIAIIITLFVQ